MKAGNLAHTTRFEQSHDTRSMVRFPPQASLYWQPARDARISWGKGCRLCETHAPPNKGRPPSEKGASHAFFDRKQSRNPDPMSTARPLVPFAFDGE